MSARSMAIYAERARVLGDPLLAVARLPMQREAERRIVADVAAKLELQPADELLEIGSSIGNLAIPLSFMVAKVTAIDHPDCLYRLEQRAPRRIELLPGNFLELEFGARRFDKILVYATLHYLTDTREVWQFVLKAAQLLRRGGRLLLGDLPNADAKRRFAETPWGQWFVGWWARRADMGTQTERLLTLPPDPELVFIGDDEILEIVRALRQRGFESYLIPQPADLPFGCVREDILVVRR